MQIISQNFHPWRADLWQGPFSSHPADPVERHLSPAHWTQLRNVGGCCLEPSKQAVVFFFVVVVPNALLIAWVKEQGQFKSLIPPGSLRALHEK